ncbi:MAG: NIPSNAP family protein, partial [bacterium]
EKILLTEIMPLVQELGILRPAIWKTFVGQAGEFMELWEFQSVTDFEEKWRKLVAHPRLEEIFQMTGPMVEDECFTLLEQLQENSRELDLDIKHYSV